MKIYVEVTGGLANQLFQWAAGHILAEEFNADLVIDGRVARWPWERGLQVTRVLPDLEVLPPSATASRTWSMINGLGHYPRAASKRIAARVPRRGRVASTYAAAERVLEQGKDVRLRGYFQDVERLALHRDLVAPPVTAGISALATGFNAPAEPYIAVHVRRGDYVSVPEYQARFGACDSQYFVDSVDVLDSSLPVYVASDDHAWVSSEILTKNSRFELFDGLNMFSDLMLLICSRQLVLSNSTFSWWAAYLGGQEDVVYPEPWFNSPSDDPGLSLLGWTRVSRVSA